MSRCTIPNVSFGGFTYENRSWYFFINLSWTKISNLLKKLPVSDSRDTYTVVRDFISPVYDLYLGLSCEPSGSYKSLAGNTYFECGANIPVGCLAVRWRKWRRTVWVGNHFRHISRLTLVNHAMSLNSKVVYNLSVLRRHFVCIRTVLISVRIWQFTTCDGLTVFLQYQDMSGSARKR